MRFLLILLFLCAAKLACLAGGGPLNTLVVVNDASPDSQEIGLRYARARGIPESHICHVSVAPSGTISITTWSNRIRNPVLHFIADQGLSNQIDALVFAHAFPFRIWNTNVVATPTNWLVASLTSSMYYDFHASSNAFAYGCNLNPFASNAYYRAERAFARTASPAGRALISALLAGYTADETRAALRRAALSDGTAPSGRIDLVRTSDGFRSVRWPLHEEADFRAELFGKRNEWQIRYSDPIPISTNAMGYHTGRANVPDIFAHHYAPGAYADHLTSYGGILDGGHTQTIMLDWLKAGAAGSYGTVVEPCAYTLKFTDPLIYTWYERGFSLGEALYMSVGYPYQGLFVGDPLAAPYAMPSSPAFLNATNGMTVTGVVTLNVAVASADARSPVSRIELFVEGRRAQVIREVGPIQGNLLSLNLPDALAEYEVQHGDDLFACAQGLAAAVNATSTLVTAVARGDHVELTWLTLGESASNQSVAASAGQGMGSNLHLIAWSPQTTFLDPIHPAHEVLVLSGNAASGDQAVAIITLTNGTAITNISVAEAPMGALFLLLRLQGVINSNLALQGSDGVSASYLVNGNPTYSELVLTARTPGIAGLGLHVDYQILVQPGSTLNTNDMFQDFFNDNADVMRPRALVRLAEGETNLTGSLEFDTALWPNGPLRLDVVSYEGSAARVQGRAAIELIVSNSSYACNLLAPPMHRHVLRGGSITSIAETVGGAGVTTQVTFLVEGKVAGVDDTPPFEWVWETTNYAIGTVHAQALARNDAGESAVSERRPIVIFTDDDGDGLSDQWEIDFFHSATNAMPLADPDGDLVSNLDEFRAGTDPTDAASCFMIQSLALPQVTFSAVSTRLYRVQIAAGDVSGAWYDASNLIWGASGLLTWTDDSTNAPPASGPVRAYRVQTELP